MLPLLLLAFASGWAASTAKDPTFAAVLMLLAVWRLRRYRRRNAYDPVPSSSRFAIVFERGLVRRGRHETRRLIARRRRRPRLVGRGRAGPPRLDRRPCGEHAGGPHLRGGDPKRRPSSRPGSQGGEGLTRAALRSVLPLRFAIVFERR